MDRRKFLGAALTAMTGLAASRARGQQGAKRTNFVMLFIDNVGYGDLGCYGNAEVKTPRIDRLARQGVRCTSFYTASPSCMPSEPSTNKNCNRARCFAWIPAASSPFSPRSTMTSK